jgi:hypothetical protein
MHCPSNTLPSYLVYSTSKSISMPYHKLPGFCPYALTTHYKRRGIGVRDRIRTETRTRTEVRIEIRVRIRVKVRLGVKWVPSIHLVIMNK